MHALKLLPSLVIGRFLAIIGWDASVCKSNWLHVDILWFSFINLGYILWIPLKWSIIFLHSWTSTGYFSNSTDSFETNCRFSPIIDLTIIRFRNGTSPLWWRSSAHLERSEPLMVFLPYFKSLEMNRPQSFKGPSLNVGWMRGILVVRDNPFRPLCYVSLPSTCRGQWTSPHALWQRMCTNFNLPLS